MVVGQCHHYHHQHHHHSHHYCCWYTTIGLPDGNATQPLCPPHEPPLLRVVQGHRGREAHCPLHLTPPGPRSPQWLDLHSSSLTNTHLVFLPFTSPHPFSTIHIHTIAHLCASSHSISSTYTHTISLPLILLYLSPTTHTHIISLPTALFHPFPPSFQNSWCCFTKAFDVNEVETSVWYVIYELIHWREYWLYYCNFWCTRESMNLK